MSPRWIGETGRRQCGVGCAGSPSKRWVPHSKGYTVSAEYRSRVTNWPPSGRHRVVGVHREDGAPLNHNQVIGLVNTLSDPRDVVVCAAGSMPGLAQALARPATRKAITSNTATRAWVTRSRAVSRADG